MFMLDAILIATLDDYTKKTSSLDASFDIYFSKIGHDPLRKNSINLLVLSFEK
jgi:hypothetical protein